jgi:putative endopeptidase
VPLLNLDTFVKAFDIKEGDGMYVAPDKRVRIW